MDNWSITGLKVLKSWVLKCILIVVSLRDSKGSIFVVESPDVRFLCCYQTGTVFEIVVWFWYLGALPATGEPMVFGIPSVQLMPDTQIDNWCARGVKDNPLTHRSVWPSMLISEWALLRRPCDGQKLTCMRYRLPMRLLGRIVSSCWKLLFLFNNLGN